MRRACAISFVLLGALAPVARAIAPGSTALVDRPTGFGALPFDGIGDASAGPHSLTPDGHYAVFSSRSNVLVPSAQPTATNVYRVNLVTGAVVQVDTTAGGGQPDPGSTNSEASISADGNYVGFMTNSPAIDSGASASEQQYVVKDMTTGAIEPASLGNGPNGAPVADLQ
jgi:hypothetical protein